MQAIKKIGKLNSSGWVRPEVFNVTPDLLGMPLARPSKRALAIGLDAVVIALLSSFGSLGLLAGIAIAGLQFWKIRAQSWKKKIWIVLVLLLLASISLEKAVSFYAQLNTPATEALNKNEVEKTGNVVEVGSNLAASSANNASSVSKSNNASDSSNASEIAAINRETANIEKIAKLERQLELARLPKPLQWRAELMSWESSIGAKFGWAFLYFTFLPYWWKGQTIGKKVFGLRVVELTGKPLTIMNCLGRYGGYAAGMATGMIGFIQVLWDVNRQAIQDKIAHTVVADLRQPRRIDLQATTPANIE